MAIGTNRIFDDIARLMTDAAGAAQGVRREAETVIKSQLEKLLRDLDVVTREDFEAVREMALIAREENDALSRRLAALEARLGGTPSPAPTETVAAGKASAARPKAAASRKAGVAGKPRAAASKGRAKPASA